MKLKFKRIISVLLVLVVLGVSSAFGAQGANLEKMSEDLQNIIKQMSEEEKTDVYLAIAPGIKYDGTYNAMLERRVLEKMGLKSAPTWQDDPEGHRQFEALRYSMLMEDYNKNAIALLELLDVPEEDNITPTGVNMYWHWRLTVSQINLASDKDYVIKMQTTEFIDESDDEEPTLESGYEDRVKEIYPYLYDYKELYYHYDNNGEADWVLISGEDSFVVDEPLYLVIGNRVIIKEQPATPFWIGMAVYDIARDKVSTIYSSMLSQYDGLEEAFNKYGCGKLIGDIDGDNAISILDAVEIQRCCADNHDFPVNDLIPIYGEVDGALKYYSDFNRDGTRDILDAVCIQRYLVGLT